MFLDEQKLTIQYIFISYKMYNPIAGQVLVELKIDI